MVTVRVGFQAYKEISTQETKETMHSPRFLDGIFQLLYPSQKDVVNEEPSQINQGHNQGQNQEVDGTGSRSGRRGVQGELVVVVIDAGAGQ